MSVAWTLVTASDAPAPDPQLVGEVDRRRLDRLDVQPRRMFLAGRMLLTDLLTRRFGTGTVDTGACPVCGGDHGPPVVHGVDARASVSYADSRAGGLVVAAVGEVARLGLDVEPELTDSPAERERADDLGRLLDVPAGRAVRRWTQVEAVLKADGRGLRVDPSLVRIAGSSARVADDPAHYRLPRITGPPGFCISVAWSARPATAQTQAQAQSQAQTRTR